MTLISTTRLCARADLERLLSAYAVEAFSDHEQNGITDDDVVNDAIDQASEELLMFLHERYLETDLATSPMIARWATTVAAYFLCMRRGNPIPDPLVAEYQRIMDPATGLAYQIANGERQIPGIPMRCDMRPRWSNLLVDRRYPLSKVRVSSDNSSTTGTALIRKSAEELYPYVR